MLDIDSLRYKVKRSEELRPEFKDAYFIKSPWHYEKLLDDLILVLTPREQEENKWAILHTYEWLADHKEFLTTSGLQDFEKQKILIKKYQEFSSENVRGKL